MIDAGTEAPDGTNRGVRSVSRRDATAMLLASAVPRTITSLLMVSPPVPAILKIHSSEHPETFIGAPIFGNASAPAGTNPSVLVQSIGGALPAWAAADVSGAGIDGEIVLARQPGSISDIAGIKPSRRIVLFANTFGDYALPDSVLAIHGTEHHLDIVGETLFRVMTGSTMIGIDLADIRDAVSAPTTGAPRQLTARTRVHATVFDGPICICRRPNVVRSAFQSVTDAGLTDVLFVAVLVSQEITRVLNNGANLTRFLYDSDALFQYLEARSADRSLVVTAMTNMSRDGIVILRQDRRKRHS